MNLVNLNHSQRQAVEYGGSHLLIVAGPGTGKTHTLACRMAKMVGILKDSQKILAITFTNKASSEMKLRLEKLCAENFDKIFVGTFHQFCLSVLRRYPVRTLLPENFRIGSSLEIQEIVKVLWPSHPSHKRQNILEEISRLKSRIQQENQDKRRDSYDQFLRKNNVLDFDDLLLETVNLFERNTDILDEVQASYPFIFVDEYQDVNEVQHALLKKLAGQDVLLTAIGDPRQAIYGFRGSDVRFFKQFTEDFDKAAILNLKDNYRCSVNLLKAASDVVEKDEDSPILDVVVNIAQKGRLIIYRGRSAMAEAEYVVHQIERLIGGTSMFSQDSGRVSRSEEGQYSFADIAVLYRLNALNRPLREAFERSGIPYQISGEDSSPISDESYQFKADKVSLLTLHASKGLEFAVVFIIGCEETILPLDCAGMKSNGHEERRLFYVGMTRAKERLYLTRAEKRLLFGQICPNKPSIFLKDIEESLKEYEQDTRPIEIRSHEVQLNLFDAGTKLRK